MGLDRRFVVLSANSKGRVRRVHVIAKGQTAHSGRSLSGPTSDRSAQGGEPNSISYSLGPMMRRA